MTTRVIGIESGEFKFKSRLEETLAPRTCERFLTLLPLRQTVIHARWSGEAVWIPLGDFGLEVGFENHTCHGSRGDVVFYPEGYSET